MIKPLVLVHRRDSHPQQHDLNLWPRALLLRASQLRASQNLCLAPCRSSKPWIHEFTYLSPRVLVDLQTWSPSLDGPLGTLHSSYMENPTAIPSTFHIFLHEDFRLMTQIDFISRIGMLWIQPLPLFLIMNYELPPDTEINDPPKPMINNLYYTFIPLQNFGFRPFWQRLHCFLPNCKPQIFPYQP